MLDGGTAKFLQCTVADFGPPRKKWSRSVWFQPTISAAVRSDPPLAGEAETGG
jgi:hypothetical protein